MTVSAKVGDPPANEDDYYIIKWWIGAVAQNDPDAVIGAKPENGFSPGPFKPPGYVFETRRNSVIIGGSCMIAIIVILSVMRTVLPCIAKVIKWGWDDTTFMIAAVVAVFNQIVIILTAVLGGAGNHSWDYTYHQLEQTQIWATLSTHTYYVALALLKVSLVLFVLRLVGLSSQRWKVSLYILLFICVLYTIATCITAIFVQHPFWVYFHIVKAGREGVQAEFLHWGEMILALNMTNAGLDFILACIPMIFFLGNIHVPLKKKLRFMFLFVYGLGTGATAVLKWRLSEEISASTDRNYVAPKMTVIGFIEMSLCLFAACSPMFNSYYILIRRKFLKLSSSSYSHSDRGEIEVRHLTSPRRHRRDPWAVDTNESFVAVEKGSAPISRMDDNFRLTPDDNSNQAHAV